MKCKMCGKEYCSKQNYEKHIKSGSCQVTYKCNECQKIFKKMSTLMEHMKKIHPDLQVLIENFKN